MSDNGVYNPLNTVVHQASCQMLLPPEVINIIAVIVIPSVAIAFSIISFFWTFFWTRRFAQQDRTLESQQRALERQYEQIAKKIDRRDDVLFELARQLRLIAEKFQRQFPFAQSPIIVSGSVDRPREEKETPEEASILDQKHIYLKRIAPLLDMQQKIEDLAIELESSGGEDFSKYVAAYDQFVRTMLNAIRWIYRPNHDHNKNSFTQREFKKHENILTNQADGEWLRASVNETTKEFRRLLSKYTHADSPTIAELPTLAQMPISNADLDAAAKRLEESNDDSDDDNQASQNRQISKKG